MNFLKKGPELKLSAIKVPDFLLDIYYDLKERHLLPVAAVLLIAIVVVPIALTQSGESEEEATAAAGATASGATTPESAQQLVAKSTPRLRQYQRRLSHLRAKDPFVQHYAEDGTAEVSGETGAATTSEGSAVVESTAPSSATEPIESSVPVPVPSESSPAPIPATPPSEGEPQEAGGREWFSYAIDVRVVATGQAEASSSAKPKSSVRRNLPELTMLPSRTTPALVYIGSTKDGKKALMMVSSDVTAVFGDAKCVIGSQSCELLAMEPNLPETLVYGGSGKTYKVELRKIHLVASDEINRAPLGEPSKQQDKGDRG